MNIIRAALLLIVTSGQFHVGYAQHRVILDEAASRNLGIETQLAVPSAFEHTLFALGRIETLPPRQSIASSRIAGRIVELFAYEGDTVSEGQLLGYIESLQIAERPSKAPLLAPGGGTILKSHAQLGMPVAPEMELFEIADLSEVYAVASIPLEMAERIPPGARARIRFPGAPNADAEAELERFAPVANADYRTLDAYFRMPNPNLHAKPRMRAEFAIVIASISNALSVPKESVLNDASGRFVFVRDYDLPNAYQRAPIRTGLQNDTRVEVAAGLFPGDEVVSTGAYALQFAGAGTLSLKEALDAAHGHEHNEDGSELTAAQRRQRAAEGANSASPHNHGASPLVLFLGVLCGLLLVLLALSMRRPNTR